MKRWSHHVRFNADYTATMALTPRIDISEIYKITGNIIGNVIVIQLQCYVNTSVNMCDIVPRASLHLTRNSFILCVLLNIKS